MNQRTIELAQLLGNERDEVSIAGLSELYQVSEKTIRNDIKEMNTILEENHHDLILFKRGGKIRIPDNFSEALYCFHADDYYSYKLSKEERIKVAAALLINSSEYVTLVTIADVLFVSRVTVINDLKEIKKYIADCGLEVISSPNKGIRVAGLESVKREALLHLLRPDDLTQQESIISKHVSVQEGNRFIIEKIIREQEQRYNRYLDDFSYREVLLFLSIMVSRNLAGETLESMDALHVDRYAMAQETLKYISQYCNVVTTESDIVSYAKLLGRVRYMRHANFSGNIVKIQVITRQYIAAISNDIGVNLNDDYDFFENLSNHLESVFFAPTINYPEIDIVNEVLEHNIEALEAVNDNLPMLTQFANRELGIMDIKFIAIHVCAALERKKSKEVAFHVIVACHAGLGTSRLLLEKLKQHFKFRIVDVISAHEAKNLDKEDADLVISTVRLESCPIENIVVSPNFSDEDYIRVGSKIDTLKVSRNIPDDEEDALTAKGLIDQLRPLVYGSFEEEADAEDFMRDMRAIIRDYFKQSVEADADIFAPYLHHLLPPSHITLDVECEDWRDAIRKSAETLLKRGYIENRYIDAMISSVEKYGPYIVLAQGFAIPHAKLEDGSIRLGMNLIRLKTPVRFTEDEEYDPVEFVCCMSAIDSKSHLKAFFNMINMVQNEECKEKMRQVQTAKEMALLIEKYEYSII